MEAAILGFLTMQKWNSGTLAYSLDTKIFTIRVYNIRFIITLLCNYGACMKLSLKTYHC